MNKIKKETANYFLDMDDVLQKAREMEVKINPGDEKNIIGWIQGFMGEFFEFAKEELLSAAVKVFSDEVQS